MYVVSISLTHVVLLSRIKVNATDMRLKRIHAEIKAALGLEDPSNAAGDDFKRVVSDSDATPREGGGGGIGVRARQLNISNSATLGAGGGVGVGPETEQKMRVWINEAVHEAVAKAVGQALDRGLQVQQTRPERPEGNKASGHGTTQAQDERKDARGRRSSSEAPVGRPWTPSMLQATYLCNISL